MPEVPNLTGANCADLPPQIVDKYFDIDSHKQRWEARTARAICGNCVVRAACLAYAMDHPPARGIVAGITAGQVLRMRSWRLYDLGLRDTEPSRPRPTTPPHIDAVWSTERTRRTEAERSQ